MYRNNHLVRHFMNMPISNARKNGPTPEGSLVMVIVKNVRANVAGSCHGEDHALGCGRKLNADEASNDPEARQLRERHKINDWHMCEHPVVVLAKPCPSQAYGPRM